MECGQTKFIFFLYKTSDLLKILVYLQHNCNSNRIMKKTAIIIALLLFGVNLHAQSISYIEATQYWYYVYDQNGKNIKTLSSSIGELQGFCSSFFIVKSGAWYHIYNAKGNKTKTLSVSSVGQVLSVSADTFTSKSGSWIYTWDKDGKKIGTRAARN